MALSYYAQAPKDMHLQTRTTWHTDIIQDPGKASQVAEEQTSKPNDLTPAQVSISISIVTNLRNEVLNNSEVR